MLNSTDHICLHTMQDFCEIESDKIPLLSNILQTNDKGATITIYKQPEYAGVQVLSKAKPAFCASFLSWLGKSLLVKTIKKND